MAPSKHPDAIFDDMPLTAGTFAVTFEQDRKMLHDSIKAIHTRADGKETRFDIHFVDPERRKAFREGLGAQVQAMHEARCTEAFRKRDASDAIGGQTPNLREPAMTVVALGGWDRSLPDKPIFIPAEWAWKDAQGQKQKSGRVPHSVETSAKTSQAQEPKAPAKKRKTRDMER